MDIKLEPNPIGTIQKIKQFEEKIADLKQKWDEQIRFKSKKWIDYLLCKNVNLTAATNFLLFALDDLVFTIDNLLEYGPDKKATVLNGLDRLYEYVLKEGTPIWLRPIAAPIKNYVIYTLASNAIDWIVKKYKNGSWREKIKIEK
jgi:hypothetical protein